MKKRIVVFLLVVCVIIIVLFEFVNSRTIYIGSNTRIISFGPKIYKFNSNKKVLLKKVNVYRDGKQVKGFLKSSKEEGKYGYYVVNSNNKTMNVDPLIASGSFAKLNVVSSKYYDNNYNEDIINRISELLEKEISFNSVMNYKRISFDIDNDSVEEEIYLILYNENESFVTNIFVYKNENVISIIDSEIDYTEADSIESYSLAGLIDFNNDKMYEIVLSKSTGDDTPTVYDIYTFSNDTVKKIK